MLIIFAGTSVIGTMSFPVAAIVAIAIASVILVALASVKLISYYYKRRENRTTRVSGGNSRLHAAESTEPPYQPPPDYWDCVDSNTPAATEASAQVKHFIFPPYLLFVCNEMKKDKLSRFVIIILLPKLY